MNIKTYESLLPFLVVEAINTQNITFNLMSVKITDSGWAWLVTGKKLLVWKFKQTSTTKSRRMLSPCFDLKLPQTDLIHRADLINVFFMPQQAITVPAALVISPEGTIRFWSNIANERFTESTVTEAQGQEFCNLECLSPLEYLIATTTGSVYLLNIDTAAHNARSIFLCSPLSLPAGLLSGFSRRVTNLFFGPVNADIGPDARRPLITVPKYSQSTIDMTGSTDRPFFVMSSSFKLRHWSRSNEGVHSSNQLVREWDLQKSVYMKLIAAMGLTESDLLSVWPVDMITNKTKELLILLVILDTSRNNAIHYATCVFNPYQIGDTVSQLILLKSHTWNYSNESEDQLLAMRFLERRVTTSMCFMYDRKFLFLVQHDQDIIDAVDYGNQGDGILGAGMVDNYPVLFTQRDGLTYVSSIASNKSRLNDTSIQLEPPHSSFSNMNVTQRSRHHVSQIEPMVIEIDVEADEVAEEQHTEPNQSTRHPGDRTQSIANQSVANDTSLNQSAAERSMRRKLDSINEILESNREFEWIKKIDAKQYGEASEVLAKLAEESDSTQYLQGRRETLMAIGKLAQILAE